MALPKNIIEQRGLILGEENEYYSGLIKEMRSIAKMDFIFVQTEEELIDRCYNYEPMLIVTELTPKNIGILTVVSRLSKFRQAICVGLSIGENDGYKRLADEFVITDSVPKSGIPRKDSFSVLRVFMSDLKYGINLKTIAKRMPVVNEICWHDVSWDEKFLRKTISDKLDTSI